MNYSSLSATSGGGQSNSPVCLLACFIYFIHLSNVMQHFLFPIHMCFPSCCCPVHALLYSALLCSAHFCCIALSIKVVCCPYLGKGYSSAASDWLQPLTRLSLFPQHPVFRSISTISTLDNEPPRTNPPRWPRRPCLTNPHRHLRV